MGGTGLKLENSLVATWLTWGAAFIFISLRVFHRTNFQRRRLELGDALLIVALVVEMGNRVAGSVLLLESVQFTETSPEYKAHQIRVLRFDYAQGFLYIIAIHCVKFSFIAGYWKLRPSLPRTLRIALWVVLLHTVLAGIIPTVAIRLSWCRLLSLNWTMTAAGKATCQAMYIKGHVINHTVQHVISDLAIIIFGLTLLSYLPSSPTRVEIPAVLLIVLLGVVSITASIARFMLAYKGDYRDQGLWCSVEVTSGVAAACLPCFRAWYRGIMGRSEMQKSWGERGTDEPESRSPGIMGRGKCGRPEGAPDVLGKRSREVEREQKDTVTDGGLGWRSK